MSTSASVADERAADVVITEDELTVRLMDGRAICTPLVWYPRLLSATAEQRANWKIIGGGYGIHWEDVDEDLSVRGMLRGNPAGQQAPYSGESIRGESRADMGGAEFQPVANAQVDKASDEEKGILDFYIEAEESASALFPLVFKIGEQIENVSTKINRRVGRINDLTESPLGAGARDLNTIFMQVAADINEFSKEIEDIVPQFDKHTSAWETALAQYISMVRPEEEGFALQLINLKNTVETMVNQVRESKTVTSEFRDVVQSVRDKRMSFAINKATTRQAKVLDSLIASIDGFESFALRTIFQIDKRLGQAS